MCALYEVAKHTLADEVPLLIFVGGLRCKRHSRGSPTKGTKSEVAASILPSQGPKRGWNCYITPAFSGVPNKGDKKSEVAASPLPSRGPKRGRNCYVTPAFSGVPKKGSKKALTGPVEKSP